MGGKSFQDGGAHTAISEHMVTFACEFHISTHVVKSFPSTKDFGHWKLP